ncbi:DUF4249 family protein [Algoriphagus chordae]|uniref:Uncharacterized protein DUF4249 n=1 Tax=Algoriphagus chordae TaxID=237019 RepID=A0A2W7QML1_9BACT|nr:DUF4249 family protein [Algoriphagus chordae]PZX49584.1 uncharacterized protein DUF4249 [Algoriphagus chordae]
MNRFWLLIITLFTFSCQIEVDLPLATVEGDVPVIEALWSDLAYYNEVKVTLAKDFLDTVDNTIIKNAEVMVVASKTGTEIPFRYYEEYESYRPAQIYQTAHIGEDYTLKVKWEENEYEAKATMLAPPILDSLTYEYQEERLFRDEGYYIKVYGEIPFTSDNYYRIKVIENDSLKNGREDYLLFDDTFGLDFFEEGLELGYAFDQGDKVRLELYRLNEEPYNYLNQLVGLLFSDGGLFSPPPQNPETNIKVVKGNPNVLGYFNVSPILVETVLIEEEDD